MVSPLVPIIGSLVLGLADPSALSNLHGHYTSRLARPVDGLHVAATVDNFSPQPARPKRKPQRKPAAPRTTPHPSTSVPARSRPARVSGDDDGDVEAPRRPTGAPSPRRRATPAEDQTEPDDGAAAEGETEEEDDDGERAPPPRRARRPASSDDEEGEDDEDEDAPLAALPSVLPRLISFAAGGGMMSRGFGFNTALQKDSAFPRPGFVVAVESYPLLRTGNGWLRQLGMGANLAMEFGALGVTQQTGGTLTYPVSQRRYAFDVRYAFIPGARVVVVPSVGIGNSTFNLKTNMPMPPSACATTSARPCIPGIEATYLVLALHLRVAATEHLALTLSGGYLMGLAVGRGVGQIGQERTPSMSGFYVEVGSHLMLTDWLALRVALPFISHAFTFSGGTATYTGATESYLGATASAVLFTQ